MRFIVSVKISSNSIIQNEKGGVLLTVLALGIVCVIGLFYSMDLLNNIYTTELTTYYKKRAELLRNSMMGYIRSDEAWSRVTGASVNSTAGFNCLATKSCSAAEQPFSLFNANGTRLSDPSDPHFGVDLHGNPCTAFSVDSADESCVMRFDFTWVVDCASCVHQAPRVIGKLTLSTKNRKVIMNMNNYAIDFARGKEIGTIGETCKSLKGVFDSATGQCKLPFVGVPCTTASTMNGTLPDGEVNCELSPAYGPQSCPPDMKSVGIDAKGQVLCETI